MRALMQRVPLVNARVYNKCWLFAFVVVVVLQVSVGVVRIIFLTLRANFFCFVMLDCLLLLVVGAPLRAVFFCLIVAFVVVVVFAGSCWCNQDYFFYFTCRFFLLCYV